MHYTDLPSKTSLKELGNQIFKIGSEYKIYQPKAFVFMHYHIFFRCRNYTYNEYLKIYIDNPRFYEFIIENYVDND